MGFERDQRVCGELGKGPCFVRMRMRMRRRMSMRDDNEEEEEEEEGDVAPLASVARGTSGKIKKTVKKIRKHYENKTAYHYQPVELRMP